MNEVIHIWQQESREVIPGYHGRFVHSKAMTHAYWEIESAAELPEHAHHHEQVLNLIEGEFELTVAGESMQLKAGDLVVLHSNVPHSGRAITKCKIIDVFSPARDDYR
ncbi:MAG: cupin domain-containing protein [Mariniblastus sp.]|nr:cupin domain-containing protein [Mariniblastus sp.]